MDNACIIQKAQDFSKDLLESGSPFSFRISIWNGICFSLSSSGSQKPMSRNAPTREVKKKTPSMRRRDQRRWEDHHHKKPSNFQTPESEPMVTDSEILSPRTGITPPVSFSQPQGTGSSPASQPRIGAKPPTSIPTTGFQQPLAGSHVPVIQPRISEDKNERVSPAVTTEVVSPKTVISTPIIQKSEEVHVSLCAVNESTAGKLGRRLFKNATYVGPHPRNKNHFVFSAHLDKNMLNQLKDMLNELNTKVNLIKIRVLSENQNYFPDQPIHFKECISCLK